MKDPFPVVGLSRGVGPDGSPLPARPVQRITCGQCGADATLTAWPSRLPADAAATKFRRRGWDVSAAGRHLCPDCSRATRKSRKIKDLTMAAPRSSASAAQAAPSTRKGGSVSTLALAAAQPEAPSVDASRAVTMLYLTLDEAYDRSRRDYKPGWSDERIAKEVGLATKVVTDRRERDFGPLAPPPEPEALRESISGIVDEIARLETEGREVASAQEGLAARQWRVVQDLAGLNGRVDDLRQMLGRL